MIWVAEPKGPKEPGKFAVGDRVTLASIDASTVPVQALRVVMTTGTEGTVIATADQPDEILALARKATEPMGLDLGDLGETILSYLHDKFAVDFMVECGNPSCCDPDCHAHVLLFVPAEVLRHAD